MQDLWLVQRIFKGLKNKNDKWIGEQKKRNYHWPFAVEHHVFGIKGKNTTNEAKSLIQPEAPGDRYP